MQNSNHTYKVKIINPRKKSDIIVPQLHHMHSKFESVIACIATKLIEEFEQQVPNSVSFNVGYCEGQQHCKMSIVNSDDLKAMYKKYPTGEITLWCDGQSDLAEEEPVGRGKRKRDEAAVVTTRRQEKEEEVEKVFIELKEKHSDRYDTPRLRLWSRMVASSLHDDLDNPPKIPAFHGGTSKRARQNFGFSDALISAAVALAKVLDKDAHPVTSSTTDLTMPVATGLSPGKSVELRMKNFQQLKYLQQLYDEAILTDTEYAEQNKAFFRH